MASSLQDLRYGDLFDEAERVIIKSPPLMRNNELDNCDDFLAGLHEIRSSVDDSSAPDQSNFFSIGSRDPMMPLPSPRPDDDLPLIAHSLVQEPKFELGEADFTLPESPFSMYSLSVLETNSTSYYSPSEYAIHQDLEENMSMQQLPRVESSNESKSAVEQQNVELPPMQQPPTVESPSTVAPVVEQQIVENDEEPLHEVAQRYAVTTEKKGYPPPGLSYPCLTAMALRNCKARQLSVTEIYSFMKLHFPYYEKAPLGWKNSVRHNLSSSKSFKKIETGTARGSLWGIEPARATEIYERLGKKTNKQKGDICKAMRHPEKLDQLVKGVPSEEEQAEVTMRRGAKRREDGEGEAQLSHVYPPAKRRNVD